MTIDVVISCAVICISHDVSLQYDVENIILFIKILCVIFIYFHDNKLKSSSINTSAKSFILFIFIENIVYSGSPLKILLFLDESKFNQFNFIFLSCQNYSIEAFSLNFFYINIPMIKSDF